MKNAAPVNATRPSASRQSLAKKETNTNEIMSFENLNGEKVELSVALTQAYFCPQATAPECYVFNAWCQHNKLDPWKKEAYLVKYGGSPAQNIVAKEAYTRRAEANPRYQGQQAGVVVLTADGHLENRMGEIVLDGEELVGGWAKVFVKDYVEPVEAAVSFKERCQYKNGEPMAKWATSPGLMIRKCALVAALREAFPSDVGGMYVAEEMGCTEDNEGVKPITRTDMENAQDAQFTPVDKSTGEVVEAEETQSEFEKEFYGTGK